MGKNDKEYNSKKYRKNEGINYNVGLDIGTGSVGWAVTDQDSNLLKKGNKNLWGMDIFPSANTAKKRRVYRGARRRYIRRKQRISFLQDLMDEMVKEKDPYFFKKLQLSYLVKDDRDKTPFESNSNGSILFADNFDEKKYHEDYPTIYHLRYDLMTKKEKFDSRLVYLAIHHIIKYRGNFLYSGKLNLNDTESIKEDLKAVLISFINDDVDDLVTEITNIVNNSAYTLSVKKDKLLEMSRFKDDEETAYKEITKAILGYKFDANCIVNSSNGKIELSFRDSDIDDRMDSLESSLGDNSDIIFRLQRVYSYGVLFKLVNRSNSSEICYSKSMKEVYEKHEKDLELLKDIVKSISDAKYSECFHNSKIKNNYWSYINDGKTKIDKFYAYVRRLIENCTDKKTFDKIVSEMNNYDFLPKQNTRLNSALPYQINENELISILDNQEVYYPELKNNREKILSLLRFRIPYYVGPLSTNSNVNHFSWIVKNNTNKITPWNFDDVVNKEKSAEVFINRMRNHCTYLINESTMPKYGLLQSEFEVRNELNKIRLNNKLLDQKTKELIISGLFLKQKEITSKSLKSFLIDQQVILGSDECLLTGFQKEDSFSTSLKSWIDFIDIFGKKEFYEKYNDIERIIEYLTIYNEKSIIETRIRKEFKYLNEEQIKKILQKKYSGYGRLSRKLLDGLKGKDLHKNDATIMDVLRNSSLNFMQIINDKKLGFKDEIRAEMDKEYSEAQISYDDVNRLQGSPALKRGIWQSIMVTRDIVKYMRHEPDNIFIEFAREESDKNRTESRKSRLKSVYKKIVDGKDSNKVDNKKDFEPIYAELINEKSRLDDDMLYLYYLQNGKSLYSGKPLTIETLSSTCQIDHILPRCFSTDNSLDNRALVLIDENQLKSDDLVLAQDIVNKMKRQWLNLKKAGLMSGKKLERLLRTHAFSENEQCGFINRQLVETRQICVNVASILDAEYKTTKVVSYKAGMTTNFRRKYKLYKCRLLNNTHHAHDAYFACLIGNYIFKKYPFMISDMGFDNYNKLSVEIKNRMEAERNYNKNSYQRVKNFSDLIVDQLNDKVICDKNGVVIWEGTNRIEKINKYLNYKDYFVHYPTYEFDGGMFNENLTACKELKDDNIMSYVPAKKDRDCLKYGGHQSLNTSFGMAIEYTKGGRTINSVVTIPVAYARDKDKIMAYIGEIKGIDCESTVKLLRRINLGQEFILEGVNYTMTSPTEWKIRKPLYVDKDSRNILYYVENGFPKNMTNDECNNKLNVLFETILDRITKELPFFADKCNLLRTSSEVFKVLKTSKKEQIIKSILSGINGDSTDIDFVQPSDEKKLNSLKKQGSLHTEELISDEDIKTLYKNLNNSFEFGNPLKEFIDYSAESFLKLDIENRTAAINMLLGEMSKYENIQLNDNQKEIINNISVLDVKEDKHRLNDLLLYMEATIEKHIIQNCFLPKIGKYLKENKKNKEPSLLHYSRFGRLCNKVINLSKVNFVFTSPSGIWTATWPNEISCSNGKSKK